MTAKNAVLAYRGGLDTSVTIRWVTQRGFEVYAVAADVGRRDDLAQVIERGKRAGAASVPGGPSPASVRAQADALEKTLGARPVPP